LKEQSIVHHKKAEAMAARTWKSFLSLNADKISPASRYVSKTDPLCCSPELQMLNVRVHESLPLEEQSVSLKPFNLDQSKFVISIFSASLLTGNDSLTPLCFATVAREIYTHILTLKPEIGKRKVQLLIGGGGGMEFVGAFLARLYSHVFSDINFVFPCPFPKGSIFQLYPNESHQDLNPGRVLSKGLADLAKRLTNSHVTMSHPDLLSPLGFFKKLPYNDESVSSSPRIWYGRNTFGITLRNLFLTQSSHYNILLAEPDRTTDRGKILMDTLLRTKKYHVIRMPLP